MKRKSMSLNICVCEHKPLNEWMNNENLNLERLNGFVRIWISAWSSCYFQRIELKKKPSLIWMAFMILISDDGNGREIPMEVTNTIKKDIFHIRGYYRAIFKLRSLALMLYQFLLYVEDILKIDPCKHVSNWIHISPSDHSVHSDLISSRN